MVPDHLIKFGDQPPVICCPGARLEARLWKNFVGGE